MGAIEDFTKNATNNQEVLIRLRKIIRRENSFLYGMSEVISGNFDYVFRYVYVVAFILLIAIQYIT